MTAMDWGWFLLICWGVTAIVVDSHLVRPLRSAARDLPVLGRLLTCYQCCGWWVGLAGAQIVGADPLRSVGAAFVVSGICYLAGAFTRGMLGPVIDGG